MQGVPSLSMQKCKVSLHSQCRSARCPFIINAEVQGVPSLSMQKCKCPFIINAEVQGVPSLSMQKCKVSLHYLCRSARCPFIINAEVQGVPSLSMQKCKCPFIINAEVQAVRHKLKFQGSAHWLWAVLDVTHLLHIFSL